MIFQGLPQAGVRSELPSVGCVGDTPRLRYRDAALACFVRDEEHAE